MEFYTKKMAAIMLCAFMAIPCLLATAIAKGEPAKEISVKEAEELIEKNPDDLIILDVRTPAEFANGHIKNARNMDFFGGRFDMDIERLPKDNVILVYCRSGKRSAGAAEALLEAGQTKVFHMHEGLEGWEKAKKPLIKEKKE